MKRKSLLFQPLRARNFRVWWSGRIVSIAGEITVSVTMPTLVFQLTGNLNSWATIVLLQSISRVLFVLFGGVLIDKYHPVRVMMFAVIAQVLLAGGMLAVSLSGDFFLWMFWIWAILNGVLSASIIPAINSLIPYLLGKDELLVGNAFYMSSNQVMQFVVPIVSGVVVSQVGTWSAFTIATIAPLVFFLVLATLPVNKSVNKMSGSKSLLLPIKEGFHTVRSDSVISVLVLATGIRMFGAGLLMWIGLPSLAALVFQSGTDGYGILVSALSGGAFLGSVAAGTLKKQHKQGLLLSYLTICFGISLLIMSQVGSMIATVALVVIAGITWSSGAVINTTMVQMRTVPENRGRVMAIVTLALIGTEPIAFAITSLIGNAIGPRGVVLGCGLAILAAGLITMFSRSVRQATLDTPASASTAASTT